MVTIDGKQKTRLVLLKRGERITSFKPEPRTRRLRGRHMAYVCHDKRGNLMMAQNARRAL